MAFAEEFDSNADIEYTARNSDLDEQSRGGALLTRPKQKPEKHVHINMAVQKKYAHLYRTSKSRFEGVNKYLQGAFLSKQLPIPTFQGAKKS